VEKHPKMVYEQSELFWDKRRSNEAGEAIKLALVAELK
jgi:hypothetical protein